MSNRTGIGLDFRDLRKWGLIGVELSHDGSLLTLSDMETQRLRIYDVAARDWKRLDRIVHGETLALSRDRRRLAAYVLEGGEYRVEVLAIPSMERLATKSYFGDRDDIDAEFETDGDVLSTRSFAHNKYLAEKLNISTGQTSPEYEFNFGEFSRYAGGTYDGRYILLNDRPGDDVICLVDRKENSKRQFEPARYLYHGEWRDHGFCGFPLRQRGNILLHGQSFWRIDSGKSIPLRGGILGFASNPRFVVASHGFWAVDRDDALHEKQERRPPLPAPAALRPYYIPEQRLAVEIYDTQFPSGKKLATQTPYESRVDRFEYSVERMVVSGDGNTLVVLDARDQLFIWRLPSKKTLDEVAIHNDRAAKRRK